jgi:hypothetical protein
VQFHYTPTSASWLNQVEGFFGVLGKQSLSMTDFPSKTALRTHIDAYMRSIQCLSSGPSLLPRSSAALSACLLASRDRCTSIVLEQQLRLRVVVDAVGGATVRDRRVPERDEVLADDVELLREPGDSEHPIGRDVQLGCSVQRLAS